MTQLDDMRRAIREADPQLSRFDPLPRIICLDDFDRGMCGWTQLVGNYEITLDQMLPGYAQHTHAHALDPAELGFRLAWRRRRLLCAEDGDAAAKRGAQNVTLKRLTFRKARADPDRVLFHLQARGERAAAVETDVRSFGFLYDLQVGDQRWRGRAAGDAASALPQCRGRRAPAEMAVQAQAPPTSVPIGNVGKTITHYHLAPTDWEDLPGGEQRLCYNEIPTKMNWHYLRFDFDLATMKATGFQVNDRSFDLSTFDSIRIPAMQNLWCMLNLCFFAETDTDKRAFAYLDFGLPFGRFLMLPENLTAIVARNERWTRPGRDRALRGRLGQRGDRLRARAQGPEGPAADWPASRSRPTACTGPPKARHSRCPPRENAVTFQRVAHFGAFLRVAAALPEGAEITVLVSLHLKA